MKLAIDIGKTEKELTTLIYSTLNQNNMNMRIHIRDTLDEYHHLFYKIHFE